MCLILNVTVPNERPLECDDRPRTARTAKDDPLEGRRCRPMRETRKRGETRGKRGTATYFAPSLRHGLGFFDAQPYNGVTGLWATTG